MNSVWQYKRSLYNNDDWLTESYLFQVNLVKGIRRCIYLRMEVIFALHICLKLEFVDNDNFYIFPFQSVSTVMRKGT